MFEDRERVFGCDDAVCPGQRHQFLITGDAAGFAWAIWSRPKIMVTRCPDHTGKPRHQSVKAKGQLFASMPHVPGNLDVGLLQSKDIAGSAIFLASPAAAMITGASIDVWASTAARYTA